MKKSVLVMDSPECCRRCTFALVGDCTECYCQSCLYWWSSRCTYGIIDERGYERHYSEKSIGKTVFLTREEAEKKLEEMKKNE